MNNYQSCPLITVTCVRDLALLDLQAQSFDRFLESESNIIIVVNEKDPSYWKEYFFANIEKWYKRHNLKIYYKDDFDIDWDLFLKNEPVTGWIRQQILKLAVSTKLNSNSYLLLDSQNFLVNYWSFKSRIINEKTPYRSNSIGWAKPAYDNYAALFGLSTCDAEDIKMSISTPFYMNTSLVTALLENRGTLKDFSRWFFNYGEDKSEFALYLAWLEFNGGIEKYHYEAHNWVFPMLRDSFDFSNDVSLFLKNVGNFTSHRWSSINFRAWIDLDTKQYSDIVDKLRILKINPNFKKLREEYKEPF
jgi:hypothetical protein